MVKSWQEHQDANDQDGNGPVCPLVAEGGKRISTMQVMNFKIKIWVQSIDRYLIVGFFFFGGGLQGILFG